MEEVRTLPNDTNDDTSCLVLNDSGTSTSPIPFPLAACDTGDVYVTPVECTTDPTPTVPAKPDPTVPIVTPSAPVASTPINTTPTAIMFYGDEREGEDPQQFLRTFRADMLHFAVTADQEVAKAFVDYLSAGSIADLWYENLSWATQNSWCNLEVEFIRYWSRKGEEIKPQLDEEKEVMNEVCTATEMPAPFDWATDVDKTVGAITVAPVTLPVALVDHVYAEHVTFTPMSRAPRDFLALRSSTWNPWGSLSRPHHRSQPRICNSFNSRIYNTNYASKPAMPSSAPAPVQLVETVRHPQGIAPMKPVIKTISPASIPHMHPSPSTSSCEPISAIHSDSPLQSTCALLLDWSRDPLLAGLARILEALGWVRERGTARTPLCLRGAHGVVVDHRRSRDVSHATA